MNGRNAKTIRKKIRKADRAVIMSMREYFNELPFCERINRAAALVFKRF